MVRICVRGAEESHLDESARFGLEVELGALEDAALAYAGTTLASAIARSQKLTPSFGTSSP
ncbi:MAG: hypothetical protein KBT68_06835 [bacterium]|nr:hypothetical protein [Candidatus Colisoma equi]